MLPESRSLAFLGFIACSALIATALFFQHGLGLEPCPLCIMQRIVIGFIGVICLLACVHNPSQKGFRIYSGLTLLGSFAGIGLATRQLYLQSLPPDQAPACMPPLEYLVDTLPTNELIKIMFSGTGECSQVQWQLLGLSIPAYTLIAFIILAIVSVMAIRRPLKKQIFK